MGFFGVLWGFRVLDVTLAGVFEVAPDGLVGVLVALSAGDDPRLSYFSPQSTSGSSDPATQDDAIQYVLSPAGSETDWINLLCWIRS